MPGHVGKMLISSIKSVQFPFKVRFSDSGPLLPPPQNIRILNKVPLSLTNVE